MKHALRWLLGGGLGVVFLLSPVVASAQGAEAQAPKYPARSSNGQVSLSVRPVWQDSRLVVEIAANTHSVSLAGIDLKEAVRLRVEGKELAPSSATKLAGHHARGEVTFALPARPACFDIVIRGVPDQPERVLSWPVEGTGPSE